jgi:hypothetical protein
MVVRHRGSHMTVGSEMAVRLSALHTGHSLLRKIPDADFCYRLIRPQGHGTAETWIN